MTTLVWRRGLRGPVPVLHQEDKLDATDRRLKITTHKLKPEEEKLTLSALIQRYPPPNMPEL
jgi:hypothetical protein